MQLLVYIFILLILMYLIRLFSYLTNKIVINWRIKAILFAIVVNFIMRFAYSELAQYFILLKKNTRYIEIEYLLNQLYFTAYLIHFAGYAIAIVPIIIYEWAINEDIKIIKQYNVFSASERKKSIPLIIIVYLVGIFSIFWPAFNSKYDGGAVGFYIIGMIIFVPIVLAINSLWVFFRSRSVERKYGNRPIKLL